MRRPEAEQRRRAAEALGQVGERGDADPPADEERPRDGEVEAVAEGARHAVRVTRLEPCDRARPGADRVDEEPELALRRQAQAERARQHPPRRFEHEELPRRSRLKPGTS